MNLCIYIYCIYKHSSMLLSPLWPDHQHFEAPVWLKFEGANDVGRVLLRTFVGVPVGNAKKALVIQVALESWLLSLSQVVRMSIGASAHEAGIATFHRSTKQTRPSTMTKSFFGFSRSSESHRLCFQHCHVQC